MIMIFGFGIVVIGTCVSCMAPVSSETSATIEYTGGIMVILGLAMMGSQLRF